MVKLFNNLFSTKQSNDKNNEAALGAGIQSNKVSPDSSEDYYPLQMIIGTGQSIGLQRDHNEDSLFTLGSTYIAADKAHLFGIYIIADGMGGHIHGEVASGNAIRIYSHFIIERIYMPLSSNLGEKDGLDIPALLQQGIKQVQDSIASDVPGGGTTLTAALVVDDQVILSNVGDSRIYFISPEGHFEALTHDHSLVQRLVDIGEISEEESHIHPQRNVLYRAIGQDEPYQADIKRLPVSIPGYLLLCSDGLWGQVPADKIKDIVLSTPDISLACNRLVAAANEAGGPDNISVILVKIFNKS